MIAPGSFIRHYFSKHNDDPSFKNIAMAPFCIHDCLHTHWRWGSHFTTKQSKGWDGSVPYAKAGAPLVPANQKITMSMPHLHGFRYKAEISTAIPPGQWQVVNHHGSAYALSIDMKGTMAKALLGVSFEESADDFDWSWAMFYWHLRYGYAPDGLLGHKIVERIHVTDLTKAMS